MRYQSICLAALLLSACAGAPPIIMPPPPWDKGPVPKYYERYVSYWEINRICPAGHGMRTEACTISSFGLNTMVLPIAGRDGITEEFVKELRWHEEGHLRGWPADHSKGVEPWKSEPIISSLAPSMS